MTLESSKSLGGIGAILVLIGAIGFFAETLLAFAAFVGVILVLVALYGLADYYKERGIFNNALWAFIALIVGIVVAIAAVVYLFFYTNAFTQLVQAFYPAWNGDWSTIPTGSAVTPDIIDITGLIPAFTTILEVYEFFCVFVIVMTFFVWRSLKQVSAKSNVGLFGTAGILMFIGGILTALFIGWILMAIAVLFMAIAFFQLKSQPEQPPVAAMPPQPVSTPV